jgi:hypothetical protein
MTGVPETLNLCMRIAAILIVPVSFRSRAGAWGLTIKYKEASTIYWKAKNNFEWGRGWRMLSRKVNEVVRFSDCVWDSSVSLYSPSGGWPVLCLLMGSGLKSLWLGHRQPIWPLRHNTGLFCYLLVGHGTFPIHSWLGRIGGSPERRLLDYWGNPLAHPCGRQSSFLAQRAECLISQST